MGAFYPSLKVNPIDLAPNYGGTLGALGQTVGGFSGITVPFLTGILTPNVSTHYIFLNIINYTHSVR